MRINGITSNIVKQKLLRELKARRIAKSFLVENRRINKTKLT